jgi:ABC-2 type transport system ATP-binding protein
MKVKLNLAASLLDKPKLLILDEPSSGVDVKSRREIWDIYKGFMNTSVGKEHAILLTTH